MIKLLDCTLRDGGYVNHWDFGHGAIKDMITHIEKTDVDIFELGFLKNEEYDRNRTIFNSMDQIEALIPKKKPGMTYAAMMESFYPLPLEKLKKREENSVDVLRVVVWKYKHDETGKVVDCLRDRYEYCKGVVEKGYRLFVQPTAVGQYSDDEFVDMLNMYQELEPEAIYVVDTWGNLSTKQIMHYISLADKTLSNKIAIGYHGHNHLEQAFATGVEFVKSGLKRDILIDGSIYGMGRYAGNLPIELIARHLNLEYGKEYNIDPMIDVYDKYIKEIRASHIWGYYFPYYLAAKHSCHTQYGEYYGLIKKISCADMERIFTIMSDEDKPWFRPERADEYIKLIQLKATGEDNYARRTVEYCGAGL